MRAIITRPREDGSYDEVGMNNRTLTKEYKTVERLLRYGLPHWEGTLRVEIYLSGIHKPTPDKIILIRSNFA